MTAQAMTRRAGAGSMIVVVVTLLVVAWLALAAPAAAAPNDPGHAAEPVAETDTAAVNPSGTAGLSLLAAAVMASVWGVAVAERRFRSHAQR